MKSVYLLVLGMGLVGGVGMARAQTSPPSYTQPQAQAGAGLYTQNCAMCHGNAIAGKTLVKRGANPPISWIFGFMVANMPLNRPGSLSHAQYEDIMAYALQQNGYPAGKQALDYNQTLTNAHPFVNKPQQSKNNLNLSAFLLILPRRRGRRVKWSSKRS